MNIQTQYQITCKITTQEESQKLHVEVKSKDYLDEGYFNHFKYKDIPFELSQIFDDLKSFYKVLIKDQVTHFDDFDPSLKVLIYIAGETRIFSLPLRSVGRQKMLDRHLNKHQLEKVRLKEMNDTFSQKNQAELKKLIKVKEDIIAQRRLIEQKCLEMSSIAEDLEKQNQKIRQSIKNIHDQIHGPYQRFLDHNDLRVEELEQLTKRKRYWIQEAQKSKNTNRLKAYINNMINFDVVKHLNLDQNALPLMNFAELFVNLETLNLRKNQIREIKGIGKLTNLRCIDLSQNKIQYLSGLQGLNNVTELILFKNKISKIENIFHMTRLEILSLSFNLIQQIPDSIEKLSKLSEFRLINNQVKFISEKILNLNNLKICSLIGNKCYSDKYSKSKDLIDFLIHKRNVQTITSIP